MRIPNHPYWRFLGIIAVGFIISTMMLNGLNWPSIGENILYTLIYWEGSWQITTYSRTRYNSFEDTRKRIVFQVIAISSYVAIANIFLLGLLHWLHGYAITASSYFHSLRISLFVTALITTMYEAQNFFDLWKKANIDAERLKQETLLAQLEALKNQVNPHFLFNSLNTLTAIIPEDPKLAVTFVQKLSNFYRYLLQYRDQQLVSLDTEMSNLNDYIYLLQIRFGESLHWKMDIRKEDMHALIPPLSLQILAENVVKHNTISRQKPMTIHLETDGHHLIIKNPIHPKRQPEPSTHIGLANLSERLMLSLGSELQIEKTDEYFLVKIPLSKNESTDH